MPRYNTTIEDFSPVIRYSSDWRAGNSADSSADKYSDSSFTLTQTDGGTATFQFNGTSFTIFGAKRGNHGFYQVTVDGNSFSPATGQSSTDQFQVPLFTSPTLTDGLHTVTLVNQGSTFLDIDFITFESSTGQDNEALVVKTVQDSDSAFVYTPPTNWGVNPPNVGTYFGSSGHGTATAGAVMTYTFQGDAVWLYGPVGPAQSPYSVSVDGGPAVQYTATKQFYEPQSLLFLATNLGAGEHVAQVTYLPSQPGQIFAIDYANVYTTPSLDPGSSNGTGSKSSSLPSAAIAGIVIALLFVLFIVGGLLILLRRRKGRKNNASVESFVGRQSPSFQQHHSVSAYPSVQSASSPHDTQQYVPSFVTVNSRPQRAPPSSESDFSADNSHVGGVSISSRSRSIRLPLKGRSPALPPSAGQNLNHLPRPELQATRLAVEGRSQDFGTAPPDYVQATEPYGLDPGREPAQR